MEKRTYKYKHTRTAQNGTFSCTISPEVNEMLDFYCEKQNLNKSQYVNQVLMNQLPKDMQETKFEVSIQFLYKLANNTAVSEPTCEVRRDEHETVPVDQ